MIMTAAIQGRKVEPVCATEHKPAVCSCKEIWKRIGLHWLQHKQPGTTGMWWGFMYILLLTSPPRYKQNINKQESIALVHQNV